MFRSISLVSLSFIALLAGCKGGAGSEGDETGGSESPVEVDLQGAVNKGPFVLGSSVTVSPLDAEGDPTGQTFNTSTISDLGEFTVSFEASGLVALQGEGFYYNEATGKLSEAPIVLRALYDIAGEGQQAAFINLVTHLSNLRALKLIKDGSSSDDAVIQAEGELQTVLGVGTSTLSLARGGTAMNLSGGDDLENAYLFAVSSVIADAAVERAQGGSIDAALQELVNGISVDLQDDGQISVQTSTLMSEAEARIEPEFIMSLLHSRLADLGSMQTVPNLNRVLDSDGDDVANLDDTCRLQPNPEQMIIRDGLCSLAPTIGGASEDPQPGGFGPRVGAGDLDGDGKAEILHGHGTTLDILQVGDDGWLSAVGSIPYGKAGALAVEDVTGDGKMDIVVGLYSDPASVEVIAGNGSLQPSAAPVETADLRFEQGGDRNSSFGDLNGDGRLDIVSPPHGSSSNEGSYYWVGISDGAGGFTATETLAPNNSTVTNLSDLGWLGLADFTGDDQLDAVFVSRKNATPVLVLQAGLGDGTFSDQLQLMAIPADFGEGGGGPESIGALALVDVDKDSNMDLVSVGSASVKVMLGDGSGALSCVIGSLFSGVGGEPGNLNFHVADISGDGHLDVLTSSSSGISAAFGDGTGNFLGAVQRDLRSYSAMDGQSMRTADLTGDGIVDLYGFAFSGYDGGIASVAINHGVPPDPGVAVASPSFDCSWGLGGGGGSCGDGTVDPLEECEPTDLQGLSCADFGLEDGVLACDPTACTYDTSGCTMGGGGGMCGNNMVDPGEDCDGDDLAGQDCTSQGFMMGMLLCDGGCMFDTAMCM